MAYRKIALALSGCLVVLVWVLSLQVDVMSMISPPAVKDTGRPDLIMIEATAKQKAKETPAVQFLHDTHTAALKEQEKDCSACHKKNDEGVISFKFMRLDEPSASILKDIYHDGCTSCHAENAAKGLKKTGPQVGQCRQCHVESPTETFAGVSAGMDNALHFLHWNSKLIPLDEGQKTNCGQCHHEFDKEKEKLVYIQHAEEGCRSCHSAEPKGDVKKNTAEAFHGQCVSCHMNMREAKAEKTGPLDCASCHGVAQKAEVTLKNREMVAEMGGLLPRLPRKQPDTVLLSPKFLAEADKARPLTMFPVAFNHELHEQKTDSCQGCHHKTLKQSCTDCHTLQGSEDGGFVSLDRAMHAVDSKHSCVGCHNELKSAPSCAGCHAAMPESASPSAASCVLCHADPQGQGPVQTVEYVSYTEMMIPQPTGQQPAGQQMILPQEKEARAALAQEMIAKRPAKPLLVAVADIPEIVKINVLANEYQPVEMPHRKIVLSMMEKMKDNSLATVFHDTPVTMCQGCHHNSPPSKTPPNCRTCHDQRSQEGRLGRPGLLAAYHLQCMGCHTQMELEKPAAADCYSCHKKKDNG